jgi:hypothetical protein
MTQKKITVPFLNLRSGEYSATSDTGTATIRYNLTLNRLEASLDGGPYLDIGGAGDGSLYDQILGAPSVAPIIDGYLPYVDGYSVELNRISISDLLALAVGSGGGVSDVTAALPLSSSGGATPHISLTGIVAPANGGTGIALPGALNNVLTSDGAGGWTSAAAPATGIGGTIADTQVAFGTGPDTVGGSADITWSANTLAVNSTVTVSDGVNTLTVQPASIGSDAATLTIDAGTTVQVGGVATVNISGAYDLPGVDGYDGYFLTTDGAGTVSWGAIPLTGVSGSGVATQLAYFTGASAIGSETGLGAEALTWDATNNALGVRTTSPTVGAAIDIASGQLAIPDGTAAAPAIAFRDDLNKGLFSPGNDIVGIAVNGTEVARMQQTGAGLTPALLIGTTAPIGAISGSGNISVDSSDPSATSGVVMLGHGPFPAVVGTAIQESYRGGQFAGVRTLGTKTSPSQVLTDAGLWNAIGAGYTSAAGYNYGGLITVKAEEAYTSTASGGRIEFHTTLSGTSGLTFLGSATTERMRITNAGNVGIGTATPIAKLHSVGTNATAGYFFGGSLSGTSATLEAIGDISAGGDFVGQIAARSTLASGTARLLLADTTACRGQIQALQDTGDTTSGRLEFYTSLSGSRRFGGAFDSAGRFGVGTTAPASIITAQGASTTEWIRISSTAAGAGFADFYSAGTAGFQGPSGGVNTGSGIPFKINTEGVNRATFSGTEVVVNDPGNNYDLRVESQGNANMLFVDASANAVGIGTGTPSSLLSVGASSQFQVDSSGNLARINDIPYVFPPAQGGAGTILTNDGYGALSWSEGAAQATSAPISTKSSNYTLTTADGTILVNAASGGITITLPAAASAAESIFTIKKKDVTSNVVTVDANGVELIDGSTTYTLSTQYEAIKIQSDGSAWWII